MSNIVKIEEIQYKDYGRCVRICNTKVELYVTVERGPRIIRYGFIDGENEFCEAPAKACMKVNDGEWRMVGGHRLWHSPESNPRTYIPDNDKVNWIKNEKGITVEQKVEPWTQIKKEMDITLSEEGTNVKIVHKITNKNAWPIEIAAWAITVMAPGGIEVVPQPTRDTGLLPNRQIVLWPYSKMNDSRVIWGKDYAILKQDNIEEAFKFGIANEDGWAAYFNHGNLFVKKFNYFIDSKYPDFGVSYETYTTDFMVEMESVSPIVKLDAGKTITHIEKWELIKDVNKPNMDESEIKDIICDKVTY